MLTSQYEMNGRGGEGQRETKSYAEIVLSNVRVLAIDQNMKDVVDEKTPAKVGATATLEVTLHQAQVIGVAGQIGRLTLVLTGLGEVPVADAGRGRDYVEEMEVSRFLKAVKGGEGPASEGGRNISIWRGTSLTAVERR
jgi:pilus assembly protein CpaB